MPEWLTKLISDVPEAVWLAVLGWIGFELRQWRLFVMSRHGGAPDSAPKNIEEAAGKTS